MRAFPFVVPSLCCLAGCGYGSLVLPIGPDTYALSEERPPVLGGGREANRVALARAGGFCARLGRVDVILELRPDGDPFTPYYPTAVDVTFRCLPPAQAAAADASPPPDPGPARSPLPPRG